MSEQSILKPFLGRAVIMQNSNSGNVAGGSFMANGAGVIVPFARAMPRNPLNNAYPTAVNSSAFPSLVVLGKRTPMFTISAFWKPNWCFQTFFNSLVLSRSAFNNTNEFSIGLFDGSTQITYGAGHGVLAGVAGWRIFQECRCAGFSLYQSAQGGPIGVDLTFLATSGDSQGASSDSIATALAAISQTSNRNDVQLSDIAATTFGGTFTNVRSWRLNASIGQGYVPFVDGSYFQDHVASGMFSGSLTMEIAPGGTQIATSGPATIKIAHVTAVTTSRTQFDVSVNRDDLQQDADVGFANRMLAYTLIDTTADVGGNPMVISTPSS